MPVTDLLGRMEKPNQSELARICGVAQPTVWGWINTGRGFLPPEYALKVEAALGVSRHELRPDVFGPSPELDVAPVPHCPLCETSTPGEIAACTCVDCPNRQKEAA